MTRQLMTDVIEIIEAVPIEDDYNVPEYTQGDVIATGYGSFQVFYSAEYSTDRDTLAVQGRVITDNPSLIPGAFDYVRVNGGDIYNVEGEVVRWTLRGLHHIEFNVKKTIG